MTVILITIKKTVQKKVEKKKKKNAQIGTLRHVDTKTNAEEEVTACIAMKKGLSLKLLV